MLARESLCLSSVTRRRHPAPTESTSCRFQSSPMSGLRGRGPAERWLTQWIQHDALICREAQALLVNLTGRVIGISRLGASGFAIPARVAAGRAATLSPAAPCSMVPGFLGGVCRSPKLGPESGAVVSRVTPGGQRRRRAKHLLAWNGRRWRRASSNSAELYRRVRTDQRCSRNTVGIGPRQRDRRFHQEMGGCGAGVQALSLSAEELTRVPLCAGAGGPTPGLLVTSCQGRRQPPGPGTGGRRRAFAVSGRKSRRDAGGSRGRPPQPRGYCDCRGSGSRSAAGKSATGAGESCREGLAGESHPGLDPQALAAAQCRPRRSYRIGGVYQWTNT